MRSYDELFWYEWKRSPDALAYNISLAYDLQGPLDFLSLQSAFDALIGSHPYLRSYFIQPAGDSLIKRCIAPFVHPVVEQLVMDGAEQHSVDKKVDEIRRHIFNLTHYPLFKIALLCISETHHVLVLCFHHVICDGVSEQYIVQKLGEYYNAGRMNRPLFSIPVAQYLDDARLSWMESTPAYWSAQVKQVLEGTNDLSFIEAIEPLTSSTCGNFLYFSLSSSVVDMIKRVCASASSSPFCVLMAVYLIVLHRLSDTMHWMVCYGTNRRPAMLKTSIGCFINILPMIATLDGSMTFQELLAQITALRHQHTTHASYPFLNIVDSLRAFLRSDVQRFLNIALMQTHVKTTPLQLNDLSVTVITEQENEPIYDLCLEYEFVSQGLALRLNYRQNRFNTCIMDHFAQYFEDILIQCLHEPHQRIAMHVLLDNPDTLKILSTVNKTHVFFRDFYGDVVTAFRVQARKTPEALALIFKEQTISYKMLDVVSDHLATRIRMLITTSERREQPLVPLLIDTGIEQVVSMLAVLKAGAAYVPIDLRYPKTRVISIINDCRPCCIIVSPTYIDLMHEIIQISENPDVHLVSSVCLVEEHGSLPPLETHAGPLAYVLYTSGSTGIPKGVQISHRSLINFLYAMKTLLDIESNAFFMRLTPYSFDISGLEIYLPLIVGGACVMVDPAVENNGRLLSDKIIQHAVHYIQTTPTRWQLLLDTGWKKHAHLVMLCGGETLSTALAQNLLRCGKTLWNMYGPTETTIWSTAYCVPAELGTAMTVPIGKPIANTIVYILDRYLQPVPLGRTGELYISGTGVARGYLHRADLTQQFFLSFPEWIKKIADSADSDTLYKTGDLCQWSPDGTVLYVGRSDQQVKYHGHRIELGDIESALMTHPAIKQVAVVVCRGQGESAHLLTAYYTAVNDSEPSLTAASLRVYLAAWLPAYSLPHDFVRCDALPTTASGKIDRRALADLHREQVVVMDGSAVCSATENVMIGLWKEILGCDSVVCDDNFFEKGGDSVSALRISYAVQQRFDCNCTVQDIFHYARLHIFAEWLDARIQDLQRLKPIAPKLLSSPLAHPLSTAQQQFLFLSTVSRVANYNITLAWKLSGNLRPALLRESLDMLCAAHDILRTIYKTQNNIVCSFILPPEPNKLMVEKMSQIEVEPVIGKENLYCFRCDQERPVRFRLLQVDDPTEYRGIFFVFIVTVQHIAFDATSIGIFCRHLSKCYTALLDTDIQPVLPSIAPYTEYTSLQSPLMIERNLNFWKQYLSEYQELVFPFDYPYSTRVSYQVSVHTFGVGVTQWQRIKSFALQYYTTPFNVVLALFFLLLKKHTQREDLIIGVPVNTRHSARFADTIGCFVSTLPIRCKIGDDLSWEAVLLRIQEQFLITAPYQDIALGSEWTPFMPVLATWESVVARDILSLGEIFVKPIAVPVSLGKTKLHIHVVEDSDTITCHFEYATDYFHPQRIQRFAGHFVHLVETLLDHPLRRVCDISVLTVAEYRQLMDLNNQTKIDFSPIVSIDALIQKQVWARPNAVALVCEEQEITYADLNRYATMVAQGIQDCMDIYPDNKTIGIVGLRLKRSIFMVAAVWGVWKAGGAYLPLALDLPEQRVLDMLQQSDAHLVIADDAAFFYSIQAQHDALSVLTPETVMAVPEDPSLSYAVYQDPELAYVLFTSGSTGKPKGVMVAPRMVVNCILSLSRNLNITSDDIFLGVTDYSFDVSVVDFLLPLVTGGTLVLAGDLERKNSEYLIQVLKKRSITVMQATPTTWEMLIRSGWQGAPTFKILSAGEALTTGLAAALLQKGELYNLYGPTEATIYATWAPIISADAISIGRPLHNVTCYVLDSHLKPLPVGVWGELYVGGAGVATGYINNPLLTAERFIADPWQPGAILYKTGDSVRWNIENNIEFQGRQDAQVKIRGYRIELGEIENQLSLHPQVLKAVVLAEKILDDHYLVACIIPRDPTTYPSTQVLIEFLTAILPPYMIPRHVFCMAEFPLTVSGKVDRKRLLEICVPKQKDDVVYNERSMVESLSSIFAKILNVSVVDIEKNLFDLGLHSLLLLRAQRIIQTTLGVSIPLVNFFKYPSIIALARSLDYNQHDQDESSLVEIPSEKPISPLGAHANNMDIAIIGLSCQFPGADNLSEFWDNIVHGRETITHFSEETLKAAGISEVLLNDPQYVRSRGILKGVECFDAMFFDMSPQEAILTDPQKRLFMEHAWAALENAGYSPNHYGGVIGVYAGADESHYVRQVLGDIASFSGDADALQCAVANNTQSLLSGKISYKLNLTGPSLNIHTACSTGLVVVTVACEQLRARQCDMAIAGAVSIKHPQLSGYWYQSEGITSPDGHCRPFSTDAAGTVPGEGMGIVVLKRLDDALADRDNIVAVIKSYHVNNDGAHKVAYTAPSVYQQGRCIAMALEKGQIAPETIQYIEAHGTGTPLGDPIEIAALSQVFGHLSFRCPIGSVKSNIGHADAAAGMAGLIKTIQMLQNKTYAPTVTTVSTKEGRLDINQSLFYLYTRALAWENPVGCLRRAGINALGMGGTNAFLVLDEYIQDTQHTKIPDLALPLVAIFPFSAKTSDALKQLLRKYAEYVASFLENEANRSVETEWLQRVAFTLQQGRAPMDVRVAMVASTPNMLLEKLHMHLETPHFSVLKKPLKTSECIFFLPGQGSQYTGMGQILYETEPIFREALDACIARFNLYLPVSIKTVLFSKDTAVIHETKYTQPALFSVEYAMAQLLLSWGCRPRLLIGHSLGEYVAAHLAGIFTLDDAVRIVAYRAELMYSVEGGAMLSVPLSAEALEQYLGNMQDEVAIATIWSPSMCIVSGKSEAVRDLKKRLINENKADRKSLRWVSTSHAFHSPMMRTIVDDFMHFLQTCTFHPAIIPIIANIDGQATSDALSTPAYWAQQLVHTVHLSRCMQTICETIESPILISIGPSPDLQSLVAAHRSSSMSVLTIRTMLTHKEAAHAAPLYSQEPVYRAITRMWSEGVIINWNIYQKYDYIRRIPLPTYPFQRVAYWPNKTQHSATVLTSELYSVSWQRRDKIEPLMVPLLSEDQAVVYIILVGQDAWSLAVSAELVKNIPEAVCVYSADHFVQRSACLFSLRIDVESDFVTLLQSVIREDKKPYCLIDLLPYASHNTLTASLQYGYYHVMAFLKAFGVYAVESSLHVIIAAARLFAVLNNDPVEPVCATLVGAIQSVPYEFPSVSIHCIDVDARTENAAAILAGALLYEALHPIKTVNKRVQCTAYRQGYRWERIFTLHNRSGISPLSASLIKSEGVYLIIGGTGGIGSMLADMLVDTYRAHVIVLSRTAPAHARKDIVYLSADVSCPKRMRDVMYFLQTQYARIDGVIHAAGVVGASVIMNTESAMRDTILASKVQGVYILSELLKNIPLDFIAFCSSITGLTGGIGQVDYAAANACLDSLVDAPDLFHRDTRVVVIDWNAWHQVGMSSLADNISHHAALPLGYRTCIAKNAIHSPVEGRAFFVEALQLRTQPVIVSKGDILQYQSVLLDAAKIVHPGQVEKIDQLLCSEYPARLNTVIQDILGVQIVRDDDNFFDLGGHSLMALKLLADVKKHYQVMLTMSDLYEAPTCSGLLKIIMRKKNKEQCIEYDPVILLQKRAHGPALFLIHPVGGTIFCYHTLAQSILSMGCIYAIQDPGLTTQDFHFETLEVMAAFYVECIRRIAAPPYFLIGYSLGGTLAFEMAQQFIAAGQEVHFVGLIDSWAMLSDLSRDAHHFEMSMQRQLRRFDEQLQGAELDSSALLSCQWSRMQLLARYKPSPLAVPLHLYKANILLPEYRSIEDPYNHWQTYAEKGIVCQSVPGDHETLLTSPHVLILAGLVDKALSTLTAVLAT